MNIYGIEVPEQIILQTSVIEAQIYVTVKRLIIAYNPRHIYSVELKAIKALELLKQPLTKLLIASILLMIAGIILISLSMLPSLMYRILYIPPATYLGFIILTTGVILLIIWALKRKFTLRIMTLAGTHEFNSRSEHTMLQLFNTLEKRLA